MEQGRTPTAAAGRGAPETWGTEFPETAGGGINKPVLIVALVGLALAAFGVVRSLVSPAPKAAAAAPVSNIFTEQHQMMRDVVQMAREARDAQREHAELLRRQMEGYEREPE
ncbi:MAG: hypothetical protein IT437_11220 [Phycisphaerales bacterium]|nr:hypothetical protein [Phycisphaerales bacterium]